MPERAEKPLLDDEEAEGWSGVWEDSPADLERLFALDPLGEHREHPAKCQWSTRPATAALVHGTGAYLVWLEWLERWQSPLKNAHVLGGPLVGGSIAEMTAEDFADSLLNLLRLARKQERADTRQSTGLDAARFFAATVDAVEAVYWRQRDPITEIWAVINDFDRGIEDAVFNAEGTTLDSFPNLRLNFGLIYRRGRHLPDIQPADCERLK